MKYFKKIVGENVYLSPMNTDDVEIYTKWLNDYDVSGYLGIYRQMISLRSEEETLARLTSEGQNYAIVLIDGDVLVGNIGLNEIDHVNRKADIGLFIGEAANRGKGYGAEALRLMLQYGFDTLNLHNIMLIVHSDNERAIACYEKVGFRELGRRRDAKFKDGRYVDDIFMEILDAEFRALYA
jgi:RimJ/RimL family protein N-acetyltransferase